MESSNTQATSSKSSRGDWFKPLVMVFIVVIIALLVLVFFLINSANPTQDVENTFPNTQQNQSNMNGNDLGDINSSDPVARGKALSGGNCSGTGSKVLGVAPMNPSDLSVIIPYGLTAGSHVTPIDHQYYWGKVQMGDADMYNVFAPADGKIVNVSFRDRSRDGGKVEGDYRIVIMYSCTFFSYYDLMTSLSEQISAKLPRNWERNQNNLNTDILVKQGEVLGKVGGQSLDFAVWDTTKQLANFLVPIAYNNREPWKLSTVAPLDYFSPEVKAQIVPFYARTAEPIDGVLDYDKDGYAVGNWFLEGTNGYAGEFAHGAGGEKGYWVGHSSIAPDHIDPNGWIFSHGDINGDAKQFAIKSPTVLPSAASVESGLVKYELAEVSYTDADGFSWRGERATKGITLTPAASRGTALVQVLEKRKIKVEVFMGKTPDEVSEFTSAANMFDRGDNARMIESDTRR